jgi:PAS domain S-box-containing protein
MSNSPHFLTNEQLLFALSQVKTATAVHIGEDATIQTANDAMLKIWGKDSSVIGLPLEMALPELKGQPFVEMFRRVWLEGITISGTDTAADLVINGQLETFYFDFEYRAIKDARGKTLCVLHTAIDVTERVLNREALEEAKIKEDALYREQALNEELTAANEELQQTQQSLSELNTELEKRVTDRVDQLQYTLDELALSERKFKFLIQEAPIAISMLSGRELVIESANELILKIWGKTQKIIGKTLAVALPELEGQPFLQLLDDVYTTGKTFKGYDTLAVLEHNGQLREAFYDFIYQPLLNSEGNTTDIIVVAIDVTEKVTNRREIERAEESLRMAVEAARLGPYYIDVVDRAFFPSVRLKEFFGFGPDEYVPYEAVINQIHPDYRQAAVDLLEAAITKGVVFDMEYPIVQHNGGPLRWVRGIGTVQKDHKGVSRYFTGVLHEITERKLDEIRKNDFIGMVSHELKTPLTSLTAIIQVLNAKLKKSEDAFISGALDKANVQVKKMTSMINGFLNISRLESGKITIDKQRFDLSALVADTIKEAELTVYTHSIEFDNEGGPVFVNADYNKIGSVISNLISNAVKYSPGKKLVEVKCELVGDNAQVTVIDTGIGISPQDKEKLFERFYRVESTHTEHISGFGIGLYLSAEIIERHHGKIWVDSKVGEGSKFIFTLPVN